MEDLLEMRIDSVLKFMNNVGNQTKDHDLSLLQWSVFLAIAINPGATASVLQHKYGISQQTTSRVVKDLSVHLNEAGEIEGLNLIQIVPKSKAHALVLTDEGKKLYKSFASTHWEIDKLVIQQAATLPAEGTKGS